MTGATVPWVPGSGVGRRPHRGRGPDALPANYLLLCVCITSLALVVRTLGLVHLRTGSSDRGYLSRGSLAVSHYAHPLCTGFFPIGQCLLQGFLCDPSVRSLYRFVDVKLSESTIAHIHFAFVYFIGPLSQLGLSLG